MRTVLNARRPRCARPLPRGRVWLPALLLAALAAPPAQAQKIFRCTVDGRTVFQQSACAAAPAPAEVVSASEQDTRACLEHLKPLLREPASAKASNAVRDGRTLRLTVQAADARGARRSRDAACEFSAGRVDDAATRQHLKRLGWLQTAGAEGAAKGQAKRPAEESIEAAAPS